MTKKSDKETKRFDWNVILTGTKPVTQLGFLKRKIRGYFNKKELVKVAKELNYKSIRL